MRFRLFGSSKDEDEFSVERDILRYLRNRVDAWVRGRLWLQVVIGLLLGIAVGTALSPDVGWVAKDQARIVGNWLALPGRLFLGLIGMIVVMLVFSSIIRGLTSAPRSSLGRVGIKLALFVVITTSAAAALGIQLGVTFKPGSYIELPAEIKNQVDSTAAPAESGTARAPLSVAERAPQLIADIIPRSPETALVQQEMLGIVVFAILIGIACAVANPQRVEPFLKFLDALLEISMTVVKWAMFLAPWAVFGLIANLVAQVGLQTIYGMWAYIGTVILGLLILYIVYLVIVAVLGGVNPFRFAGRIGGVQLLAFSTSSTAAVMPLSIDTAVKRLNVPESVANLVIPLCATINMAGTALYQAVAVIFLAQLSGVQLSVADYTMIVMTLVASSVGAPGTPGVGIVILSSIVGNFGIPAVGIPLILGVDRLLDMCRTTVNVTGDLAACVVLRHSGQTASLSPEAATESA